MTVALNIDHMKVFSSSERNKKVSSAVPQKKNEDPKELLKEKKKILLSEIANYEKQNFDDWPDGKEYLQAARAEMYKVDNELDRSLRKK